jgi:hypothetical protein
VRQVMTAACTNSWCCARGWRDIPWLMAEAIDAGTERRYFGGAPASE